MNNNGQDSTQIKPSFQNGSKKGFPPHIMWPLFVVALLITSVTYSMTVVFASQSDGGAQVIDNYYEKAVNWDDRIALQNQSLATGWEATLSFEPANNAPNAHTLLLNITDAEANVLSGFQGVIRAKRPHTSGTVTEILIGKTSTTPDQSYLLPFAEAQPGLWDFELELMLDGVQFTKTIRKELVY